MQPRPQRDRTTDIEMAFAFELSGQMTGLVAIPQKSLGSRNSAERT